MTKDEALKEIARLEKVNQDLEKQLADMTKQRDAEKQVREQIAAKFSRTITRIGGTITALHNLGDGLQDHLGTIK